MSFSIGNNRNIMEKIRMPGVYYAEILSATAVTARSLLASMKSREFFGVQPVVRKLARQVA
jgi:hypothetical protein